MKSQSKNWMIGIIITVALAVVIIFAAISASSRNHSPNATPNQNQPTTTHITDDDPLQEYLEDQNEIMSDMMEDMEIEPSGNAAVDFLKGMIPHHESAIEMSESYLEHGGTNNELKEMAKNIIQVQKKEIEEMDHLIQKIEDTGETDSQKEQKYLDAYQKMMSSHQNMNHTASNAQDVEQAFANGMIMHHQMAVEMSRIILDNTEQKDVRDLAQSIITAQEKEIEQMRKITDKNPD